MRARIHNSEKKQTYARTLESGKSIEKRPAEGLKERVEKKQEQDPPEVQMKRARRLKKEAKDIGGEIFGLNMGIFNAEQKHKKKELTKEIEKNTQGVKAVDRSLETYRERKEHLNIIARLFKGREIDEDIRELQNQRQRLQDAIDADTRKLEEGEQEIAPLKIKIKTLAEKKKQKERQAQEIEDRLKNIEGQKRKAERDKETEDYREKRKKVPEQMKRVVKDLLARHEKMEKDKNPLDVFSFQNTIDLLYRLTDYSESELRDSEDEGDRSDYDMLRSYYPAWRQEDFVKVLDMFDEELEKRRGEK